MTPDEPTNAHAPSASDALKSKAAAADNSLYRTVWRWHFIAGVLLAPFIFVVALTGGLYIFKAELETLWYANVLQVATADEEQPLDAIIQTATTASPDEWAVDQIEIDADPARAWGIAMHAPGGKFRRLYVNQYTGQIQGEISERSFFPIVLQLHRNMFIGTLGRVIVELATCWTIILLATGLYLWWPRRSKRNRATWRPRWRGPSYLKLRDLHAVVGFWMLPLAGLIAATGLVYSFGWGTMYQLASLQTGAYDLYLNPMELTAASDAEPSWSRVRAATRELTVGMNHSILPAAAPQYPHLVIAGRTTGPSYTMALAVDGRTGEIVRRQALTELPLLAQWSSWNYPLHTGSVLGLPTKILWLAASIAMLLMPVTGVWMWLARRPRGQLGWPRPVDYRWRFALKLLVVATCIVLPIAGLSVLAAWGADALWRRTARVRSEHGHP